MSTSYPMGEKKSFLDPNGVFVFQFISLPIFAETGGTKERVVN